MLKAGLAFVRVGVQYISVSHLYDKGSLTVLLVLLENIVMLLMISRSR